MVKFLRRLKKRLNTWEEICLNEDARLRNNTILFSFLVSFLFLVMLITDLISGKMGMFAVAGFLFLGSLALFFLQFFNNTYNPWLPRVLGVSAFIMSMAVIDSGGFGGYSFIWIFLVPHIGVMILRFKESLLFNSLFILFLVLLLFSPLKFFIKYEYGPAFRFLIPLALFFVCVCLYLSELVRHRIQRQLKLSMDELKSFAFTDPLTRAYNRRALTSHFGDPGNDAFGLSFAVLDLDFFKKVNDEYGHLVGDRILCHVVSLIDRAIPPGALLYRWGGEEFLLVLKTSDPGETAGILEDIRALVETTPFTEDRVRVSITISIGAVSAASGTNLRDAISLADERLYKAKDRGRNQVVMN